MKLFLITQYNPTSIADICELVCAKSEKDIKNIYSMPVQIFELKEVRKKKAPRGMSV